MRILVGEGSCGLAAGAGKVFSLLEQRIADEKLSVELDVTGCIGNCYLEPIVDVIDDNGNKTTYVKVDEQIAAQIIDEHVKNNKKVLENVISQEDMEAQNRQIKIALKN